MKRHALIAALLAFTHPIFSFGESWTPRPKFTIDGGGYEETLIFVSGISYGLTYSDVEIKSRGMDNFYCHSEAKGVSSKLLFEILNAKLAGNHSSEEVLEVVIAGLKEKFPCPK